MKKESGTGRKGVENGEKTKGVSTAAATESRGWERGVQPAAFPQSLSGASLSGPRIPKPRFAGGGAVPRLPPLSQGGAGAAEPALANNAKQRDVNECAGVGAASGRPGVQRLAAKPSPFRFPPPPPPPPHPMPRPSPSSPSAPLSISSPPSSIFSTPARCGATCVATCPAASPALLAGRRQTSNTDKTSMQPRRRDTVPAALEECHAFQRACAERQGDVRSYVPGRAARSFEVGPQC